MGHSKFNFKSSGVRKTDHQFSKKAPSSDRPIGFKTPLELGNDVFRMHTSPIRQLSDNFRNLIMTNQGERLGMFNFGANLNSIVFEYSNSPNFEQIVGETITNITQRFMPSISIVNITSMFIDKIEKNDANKIGLAKVRIRIEYVIPKFKSPKLAIEVDLNIGG